MKSFNFLLRLRNLREYIINIIFHRPIHGFKIICFWVGLSFISFTSLLFISVLFFISSIPKIDHLDYKGIKSIAEKSTLKKIPHQEQKNYQWKKIKNINRDLIYPIVYSEDGTFFKHEGINFDAILRSIVRNYQKGKYVMGGSTITQQVAKNLYLHNSKTIIRKIKEIILARRLEKSFSKNEILEIYLNIAEFGPSLFGVSSASRYYFNKGADKINPAEGAFLALMLPSPRRNHYAIFQNKNLTKNKKKKLKRVLLSMHYEGLISDKQLKSYLKYDYYSVNSLNKK